MRQAKAIAITGIGKVEFVKIELPELQPGQLLIRTEVSAVSRGTELRCLAGKQSNSLAYPYIPGYSMVGIVEEAPAGSKIAVGTRVFSAGTRHASINLQWGAHTSYAIDEVDRVVPVPEGCTAKSAAFAKMAAIALRGTVVAEPKASDSVVVVGLGPIGMLSLRLFHAGGAKVLGLDQETARVEIARRSGMPASLVNGTIQDTVHAHFGHGADIVVDVTGVPAVLPLSMRAVKSLPWNDDNVIGSKLIIQGSYPDQFCLPYEEAFQKELHIFMPRDCTPGGLAKAVKLIADGKCKVDDLVSWFGSPADGAEAYNLLRSDRNIMTIAFDWGAVTG